MGELAEFPGDIAVQGMPKIYSPFKRCTSGPRKNKLIVGTWYDSAYATLQNATWRWTEKLDGTNIRIHWDGVRRSIAGRTQRAELRQDLVDWIDDNLPEELFEQMFEDKTVTLYGEGIGPGIQSGGGLYSPIKKFVLFEVRLNSIWVSRQTIEQIADGFGIETAALVTQSTVWDAIDRVERGHKSAYGNFFAEGLVGVPADGFLNYRGGRIMMKVKHEDFWKGEYNG